MVGFEAMAVPFGTWAFGAVGALCLLRGLWNPHRAVVHEGSVESCPGPVGGVCMDVLALSAPEGSSVYSLASGTVIAVGDRFVHIQASNEPVIVHYFGVVPDVEPGQHVGPGRRIGTALGTAPVELGVTEVVRRNGQTALVPVEPRSWLAARGFSLTVKSTPTSGEWCGPGRHITVPTEVHTGCGLENPAKARFALLPVSITQE